MADLIPGYVRRKEWEHEHLATQIARKVAEAFFPSQTPRTSAQPPKNTFDTPEALMAFADARFIT